MVLPLIPIAIAGIGGGALGGVLGGILGGSKKEELIQQQQPSIDVVVEAEPYQHFQPELQYSPQYQYGYQAPSYIIESPGAKLSKKQVMEAELEPEQTGRWETPTSVTPTQTLEQKAAQGTDFTTIAIISMVGLVAYGVVTQLGGSKKK